MTATPFGPEWDGMTHREYIDGLPDADPTPDPPLPRTNDQASRERRTFWHLIDPWAPVPDWYVAGQCVGCGGRNGHGSRCPVYVGGAA